MLALRKTALSLKETEQLLVQVCGSSAVGFSIMTSVLWLDERVGFFHSNIKSYLKRSRSVVGIIFLTLRSIILKKDKLIQFLIKK